MSLSAFLEDFSSATIQPFKGVQHRQLAITKLKIVDKFGQVIYTPAPERAPRTAPATPKFSFPCLSDQLCPSLISDPTNPNQMILNTGYSLPEERPIVLPTGDPPSQSDPTQYSGLLNPFIQITPAINQNARMNTCFLQPDTSGNWTVCTD
jgi:hypothetical protein